MRRLSKLPWPLIVPFLALCGMVVLLRFTHAEQGTVNPALVGGKQPPALNEGQQHLLQAVESSDWRTAAELLREGADPNLRRPILWPHSGKPDSDTRKRYLGDPLLKIAVSTRDESMVQLLVESGADVNAPGRFGYTALMVAADVNEPKMVKLLLNHGANPNAVGASQQESALHLVTMGKTTQAFPIYNDPKRFPAIPPQTKKYIQNFNADIRPVQVKRIAIIKLLLAGGADPTHKDASGKTPADYARKRNNAELVALLTAPKFTRKPTQAKGAGR